MVVGEVGVGKLWLLLDFDCWFGEWLDDVWWFCGWVVVFVRVMCLGLVVVCG